MTASVSNPPDFSTVLLPSLEWCEIPAGTVTLEDASNYGGTKGGAYSLPSFHIGKYPITNAQYSVFVVMSDGYSDSTWWDYSKEAKQWRKANPTRLAAPLGKGNHPQADISWFEAVAFGRWLTEKTGGIYRITLPTEQQWQRAAQGDDDRIYPWGNKFDQSKCNVAESGFRETTPVTLFDSGSSPYNVYDMWGNVYGWCLTQWGTDDNNLGGSIARAIRGSHFKAHQHQTRLTYRTKRRPLYGHDYIGFRLVASLDY